MLTDILLEEAQELLLSSILPLTSESVPLEHALGRITAHDFFAPANIPAYMQAAVDGYAIYKDDLKSGKAQIIKHCAKDYITELKKGQAAEVLTGRPLPENAGAVIAQEFVTVKGDELIFPMDLSPGSNIKLIGEDFNLQELAVPQGTSIDPGMVGVFAAFGQSTVKVYRRPRVMIISLASEVVPYNMIPVLGQSRDCNGPLLAALVTKGGGQVEDACIISGDDKEETKEIIRKMAQKSDLVLTIGRTASGKDDYALAVLRELGAKVLFWDVKIKPGSHSGAAILESKPVISLSGNPAACTVGYHLLASPVIYALQGLKPQKNTVTATISGSFPKKGGPRRFLRGFAYYGHDGLKVDLLPGQKSSMLRSLLKCNCLVDLPAGHPSLEPGAKVNILLLSEVSFDSNEAGHL